MRDHRASSGSSSSGLPRGAVRGLGPVPGHVAARAVRVHGPGGPGACLPEVAGDCRDGVLGAVIQVVIVSTWKLLTLVKNDRIFSEASLVWVNAIVWAIIAAWVVLVSGFLYVGFNADDPGLPLLLFLMVVGVSVLGLLMVVMRALLRQATTLRTDMEAVI